MRATIIAAFLAASALFAQDLPRFRWENFSTANGLPDNRVYSVCVDGGRVWAGTDNGLALYENGKWRVFSTADGLAHRAVLYLALDKKTHTLWMATMGGLSRYSAGRIDSFTQLNSGLPNDVVYGVAVQGDLVWVATAAGGARYDTRTNQWSDFNERSLKKSVKSSLKHRWPNSVSNGTVEQEETEQALKEERAKTKRDRAREEEEYEYDLQLERKKETDAYETNRKALVKELEDREAAIELKEEEYASLLERVASFSDELETAIRDTEQATTARIESHYTHQIDLSNCQVEAERKLQQHTITSLQEKIKEQEAFIKQLTQKADSSNNQVQEIALKAIEGSASRFYGAREECKKSQPITGS